MDTIQDNIVNIIDDNIPVEKPKKEKGTNTEN